MASLIVEIHSVTPQPRKLQQVAAAARDGAVLLYPTDTGFALGCCLGNKTAISRVREIRRMPQHKNLTFLCDSLSNIAEYAKVSNMAYRSIKRLIPGPFTFILPATKQVPNYAVDPKRKTSGIRVPDNRLVRDLLKEHGSPLISITAKHPDKDADNNDELIELLTPLVDVVVTSEEYHFVGESSVIDMTTEEFLLIRRGAGMGDVERNLPQFIEETA